ncbi:MAG: hypothetical protein B7Z22_09875 [Hyphomonas sp. 32-62-5]|nr:MAG: hypothetical protein B7Z22_09875 [Hyphomonas sp. 32-62-5]
MSQCCRPCCAGCPRCRSRSPRCWLHHLRWSGGPGCRAGKPSSSWRRQCSRRAWCADLARPANETPFRGGDTCRRPVALLPDRGHEAELRRVLATKAEGLFHILARIDRTALRHVGLFSSASAFFGNRGQSDYAMANAILANAGRALQAELPGGRVKVFDWGPWEGGMVDATLASHFKQQGVPLIPLAEGALIFAHELLAGDPADVELVVGTVWSDT